MQRPSLLLLLALALSASVNVATAASGAACTESAGATINLSGNNGFCYLVGQRMRVGSIYAQCKDGVLSCYADEGIPDKPQTSAPCVAPEPGKCGSAASATPAAATPTTTNTSHTRSFDMTDLN